MVFMTSGKSLVQDYYKQKHLYQQEKLLQNARKVHSVLSHWSLHLPALRKIESMSYLSIEPLLLVFFSDLNLVVIPKEAMS